MDGTTLVKMSVWKWRPWIFSKLMGTVGQFSNVCLLPPLARELPPSFSFQMRYGHGSRVPTSTVRATTRLRRLLLRHRLCFVAVCYSELFWCKEVAKAFIFFIFIFGMVFLYCVGLLHAFYWLCSGFIILWGFFFSGSLLLFLSWPVSSSGHLLPPSPLRLVWLFSFMFWIWLNHCS